MRLQFSHVALGLIFLGIVYLFVPVHVTVAPEWTVEVKDAEGRPMPGACVVQWWQHYSVEDDNHEESILTDESGLVSFPRRTLRASGWSRIIGAANNLRESGVHASFGPYSHVAAYKFGYGEMSHLDSQNTRWNGWGRLVNSHIILRRCPDGYTGLGCIMPTEYESSVPCGSLR